MASELTALRTHTSKTHRNPDGSYALEAHAGHIHYDNGGVLEDVELTFEDMGTYWQTTKASYRLYVAKQFDDPDLIRFDNRYDGAIHSIYYKPHSVWWVNMDNKTQRQQWKTSQPVTGSLNAAANKITFTNAFGADVNFEITLRRSGFTKELVLPSKPPTGGAPYANWAFGVAFRWTGDNLKVSDGLSDWDEVSYYERTGPFEVREVASGLKSYIKSAYGVDSHDPERRVELPVFFEKRDGVLWQGKLIASSLIENAMYPVRMDTTTSFYSGAGDGYVEYFGSPITWNTAHDAATGTAVVVNSAAAGDLRTGSVEWGWGVNAWTIRRAFLPIDTSALPTGATITAATLYCYLDSKGGGQTHDNDGDDWVAVVETSAASTSTLTTADYDQCGDAVDNPTEGSDRVDVSGMSVGSYIQWSLDSTGLGWISPTGISELGLREGHDAIDSPVQSDTGVLPYFNPSEFVGVNQDPYIEITYTPRTPRHPATIFQRPAIV